MAMSSEVAIVEFSEHLMIAQPFFGAFEDLQRSMRRDLGPGRRRPSGALSETFAELLLAEPLEPYPAVEGS